MRSKRPPTSITSILTVIDGQGQTIKGYIQWSIPGIWFLFQEQKIEQTP